VRFFISYFFFFRIDLAGERAKADKMLGPSVGLRLCARQVRAVYALLRGCQLTGPRAE
jgi:hypothetical protein